MYLMKIKKIYYDQIIKISCSLLLLSILTLSCSSSKKTVIEKEVLTDEISKIYNEVVFNGFSVSIVNEKEILYAKGFFSNFAENKKYTDKTIQNVASVSKTLVGIALLKAQELGRLDLDEPIDEYLPFKVSNPNFPSDKITIRHLTTHTSSIMDNNFYLSKNYYLKPDQDLQNLKLSFDEEQVFNSSDSMVSMNSFLESILYENGKWNADSYSKNKPGAVYEYSTFSSIVSSIDGKE